MEQEPHNPDDPDGDIPEREKLYPAEVDLTGAIAQDDVLGDVVYDAIGEAEEDGQLPLWGARTLARVLADLLDDRVSGGLHHFAITGRINRSLILRELAEISARCLDEDERKWAGWLELYVISQSDEPDPSDEAPPQPERLPSGGSALEKVSFYLRGVFIEADARGQAISRDDAQAVATLLAPLLDADSAMHRFAEAGEIDLRELAKECRQLQSGTWQTREISEWVRRLAHFLSTYHEPGQSENPRE